MAKVLSFAPGFTYYREPDNFDHVPGAEPRFRWLYLPGDAHDDGYARHLGRALEGRVRGPDVMAEDPGLLLGRLPARIARPLGRRIPSLYRVERGVLLKLVFSNLALDWLASAAPGARLVPVLRHPCGTYGSWARLGWEPEPERLLTDERLVADHLAPYLDVIASARGFWEKAGAEWAAVALVLSRQAGRRTDWTVVQHEWLCEDPEDRFRRLAEHLGLVWTPAAAQFVRAHDRAGDDSQRSLRRSAAVEIDKWKHQLDPEDIAACRRVVERFPLDWYPGFEPVASTPRWA